MAKTTITYWNPLSAANEGKWQEIEGLEGIAEELTLSIDEETGEYTRLGTVKFPLNRSDYGHGRCQAVIPWIPISADRHQSCSLAVLSFLPEPAGC